MALILPFLIKQETDKNREYNATGFNSLGSHRILYADYDFVDPGVYAEDDNAYYDVDDNYPDLDGDGIGEGHAFVNVYDRPDMVDCSQGPGVIHVYSWFKQEIMGEIITTHSNIGKTSCSMILMDTVLL